MKTKYLIIPTVILIMFYISSCCEGDRYRPQIDLAFIDSETSENLIANGYITEEEFSIYNLTMDEPIADLKIYTDTTEQSFNVIYFSAIPNLYGSTGEMGKEITREFIIKFNNEHSDTSKITALINYEGKLCKHYEIEYVNLTYKDTVYNLNVVNPVNISGIIKVKTK